AVRRRAQVGHERQGGLDVEPDPLGLAALDQGDVRAADRLPLSVPRVRGRRRARRGPVRLLLGVVAAALLAAALAAPAGAKRITGDARPNLLIGTAAPDRVAAGGGNDRIDVAGSGPGVALGRRGAGPSPAARTDRS